MGQVEVRSRFYQSSALFRGQISLALEQMDEPSMELLVGKFYCMFDTARLSDPISLRYSPPDVLIRALKFAFAA